MEKVKKEFQTTKRERVAYPLFSFGQNIVYGLVMVYLSLYFTDYLRLPAVTVSVIFFVSKLWDAINDPLFGILVDRCRFRRGKFKPWLRAAAFLVPIATALLFNIPTGLPLATRTALAFGLYLAWGMIYTVSDVPVFSLLTAMTGNVQERSTLVSYGSVASLVCAILIAIVFVPQLETVGFGPIGLLVSVLSFLFLTPLPWLAKERNREAKGSDAAESKIAGAGQEKAGGLREIFCYIRGNHYLLLFYSFFILNGCFAIGTTLNSYIMIYCLGSLSYQAVFTAIGVVPLLLLYLVMPRLTARFERMTLYRVCLLAQTVLTVVQYFVGYESIPLYGFFAIAKTVIGAPTAMLSFTFTMDCVEYGHYHTGIRKEGITFSVQTFANKFAGAMSGTVALLLLGLIGYDGGLEMQSATTLTWLWRLNCLVPVLGTVLTLPLLFRYRLRSQDVQVMADVNAGKLTREEGERQLLAGGTEERGRKKEEGGKSK